MRASVWLVAFSAIGCGAGKVSGTNCTLRGSYHIATLRTPESVELCHEQEQQITPGPHIVTSTLDCVYSDLLEAIVSTEDGCSVTACYADPDDKPYGTQANCLDFACTPGDPVTMCELSDPAERATDRRLLVTGDK